MLAETMATVTERVWILTLLGKRIGLAIAALAEPLCATQALCDAMAAGAGLFHGLRPLWALSRSLMTLA